MHTEHTFRNFTKGEEGKSKQAVKLAGFLLMLV